MNNPIRHDKKPMATTSETTERMYEFLSTHPVGVLATVDPNQNPHATAIYFAVDDSFEITFVTKRETKKHDNLKHNPHAMLVAYDAKSQTSVQIKGEVEDITHTYKASEAYLHTLDAAAKTSESRTYKWKGDLG